MRRFVVDCMLGKLARWLRILGFDTLFDCSLSDAELLRLARSQDRVLLTRDRELAARGGYLIRSEGWQKALKEVIDAFHLGDKLQPFTRCPVCNTPLKEITRQEARSLVPPIAFSRATKFAICPGCGRVYWDGTHLMRMKFIINKLGGNYERGKTKGEKPQDN